MRILRSAIAGVVCGGAIAVLESVDLGFWGRIGFVAGLFTIGMLLGVWVAMAEWKGGR